jgi:hypothetical protein
MSREQLAALVAAVTLIGVIFAAGQRMGTLTAEVGQQRIQIATMSDKLDALTLDVAGTRVEVMRLLTSHVEPRPR